MYFGKYNGNGALFHGNMSMMRIWDTAITTEHSTANFNEFKTRYGY